jgi:hypothetical protein
MKYQHVTHQKASCKAVCCTVCLEDRVWSNFSLSAYNISHIIESWLGKHLLHNKPRYHAAARTTLEVSHIVTCSTRFGPNVAVELVGYRAQGGVPIEI